MGHSTPGTGRGQDAGTAGQPHTWPSRWGGGTAKALLILSTAVLAAGLIGAVWQGDEPPRCGPVTPLAGGRAAPGWRPRRAWRGTGSGPWASSATARRSAPRPGAAPRAG